MEYLDVLNISHCLLLVVAANGLKRDCERLTSCRVAFVNEGLREVDLQDYGRGGSLAAGAWPQWWAPGLTGVQPRAVSGGLATQAAASSSGHPVHG
jgi:hypothetical protein